MADQQVQSKRLDGLDFARFLAFFGMVLVNFKVAAGATDENAAPWLASLHESLEGRAAALFVLLAGVGIDLGAKRIPAGHSLWPVQQRLLIRGCILVAFGMLNLLVFEADILHYYGLYFFCAVMFLPLTQKGLLTSACILVLAFPVVAIVADYDHGWNWDRLVYSDFWTVKGFLRHSFINGWHPVLPWLAFLLVGMAVARWDLSSQKVRTGLVALGVALMVSAWLIAAALNLSATSLVAEEPEIADLMLLLISSSPIPPAPIYMLTATGSALVLLSVSLWLGEQTWLRAILSPAFATGRQALTLYIAHILIGMGAMEMVGWVAVDASSEAANLQQATLAAAFFTVAAMIYATLWQKRMGQGPLEKLLRLLSK